MPPQIAIHRGTLLEQQPDPAAYAIVNLTAAYIVPEQISLQLNVVC